MKNYSLLDLKSENLNTNHVKQLSQSVVVNLEKYLAQMYLNPNEINKSY